MCPPVPSADQPHDFALAQFSIRQRLNAALREITDAIGTWRHPASDIYTEPEHFALHLWLYRPRRAQGSGDIRPLPAAAERLELWASTSAEYSEPWVFIRHKLTADACPVAAFSEIRLQRRTRSDSLHHSPTLREYDDRWQVHFSVPITGLWYEGLNSEMRPGIAVAGVMDLTTVVESLEPSTDQPHEG
jgi:hypothetical protein